MINADLQKHVSDKYPGSYVLAYTSRDAHATLSGRGFDVQNLQATIARFTEDHGRRPVIALWQDSEFVRILDTMTAIQDRAGSIQEFKTAIRGAYRVMDGESSYNASEVTGARQGLVEAIVSVWESDEYADDQISASDGPGAA